MFALISYDPIVKIHLGPLSVSPHGIGIVVGFLAGARLHLPETRRRDIPDEHVYTLLTRAAIDAVIGARCCSSYVLCAGWVVRSTRRSSARVATTRQPAEVQTSRRAANGASSSRDQRDHRRGEEG